MTRKSKIARLRREGWRVVEGSSVGTTDDRVGEWYAVGPSGEIRKLGPGLESKTRVWDEIIRHVEAME